MKVKTFNGFYCDWLEPLIGRNTKFPRTEKKRILPKLK